MTGKEETMSFLVTLWGDCSQWFSVLTVRKDHREFQSTGGGRCDRMVQILHNHGKPESQ